MCLGIPAKIQRIEPGLMPMATVTMAGQERRICLAYTPEVAVGDFVLVQNGFSHSTLSPEEAAEALHTMQSHGLIEKDESCA